MADIRKLINTGPSKDSLASAFPILNMMIDAANDASNTSNEANLKSVEAVDTANAAKEQSEYVQTQLDTVTGSGTIDPAVEQMKVSSDGTTVYNSPDERIREEHNSVTAQLAQNKTEIKERVLSNSAKPIFTFMDDDGATSFTTRIQPIAEAEVIPFSLAVNPNLFGTPINDGTYNHMTTSELLSLQDSGFEIISHGWDHQGLDGGTESRQTQIVKDSRDFLKENGFTGYDFFVYPGGTTYNSEASSRELTRKYSKLAFNTSGDLNIPPFNNFNISRVEVNTRTLTELKAKVDEAITNNSYLVFYTHSWMTSMDSAKQADLQSLIQYIKSLNVEILSVADAHERIGNPIDIGETEKHFRIGKNGEVAGITDFTKYIGSSNTLDADISFYEQDKVTVSMHFNGWNDLPNGIGGYCLTHRFSADTADIYARQTYYQIGSKNAIYTRAYTSTGWSTWLCISSVMDISSQKTNISIPITSYVYGETFNKVSTNATDHPAPGTYGLLTTVRIEGDDDVFSYQEFLPNGQTTKYMRRWDPTTLTWKAWALQ
jgi:peptidoglycan/xylan/chitin deacetylase (PgdA/CDA1 family)